jgi:hypothetical protein
MGQLAEDILDGSMCDSCGTCFKQPHGHPVTCKSCWKSMKPDERKQHQKATHPEY